MSAVREDRWLESCVRVGVAVVVSFAVLPVAVAAQWVEEPGKGWVSAMVFYHDTRDRYDLLADEGPIPFDGRAKSTAAFVTAAFGLIPNWDLWARASWNRLVFTDAADDRSTTGFGDANVWLRVAPLRYLGIHTPFAVRGGVKLPTGNSPVDAEIIPLGEGQTDWEIIAELGHSFWPRPYYISGWAGYRWRQRNDESFKDPGEEIFYLAQIGGAAGRFQFKAIAEGWNGQTPRLEGLSVRSARRKYLQITPTVGWDTGQGTLEVGWREPLLGRNLPAGGALVISYFSKFGL
jgi:outer membrane putative beta-barrel porin/alpha-amylase